MAAAANLYLTFFLPHQLLKMRLINVYVVTVCIFVMFKMNSALTGDFRCTSVCGGAVDKVNSVYLYAWTWLWLRIRVGGTTLIQPMTEWHPVGICLERHTNKGSI